MDVKRIVGFVLLGSALGIVFFVFYFLLSASDDDPGDVPQWWRGTSYTGVVTKISSDSLSVDVRDDQVRTFALKPTTRFFLWGNEPVRTGMEVKVIYKQINSPQGQILEARDVRVLRGAASPGASPAVGGSPAADASPAAPSSPQPSASPPPSAAPH